LGNIKTFFNFPNFLKKNNKKEVLFSKYHSLTIKKLFPYGRTSKNFKKEKEAKRKNYILVLVITRILGSINKYF
jgi:hypothetical protein